MIRLQLTASSLGGLLCNYDTTLHTHHCLPVTRAVSGATAAGLLQCSVGWHSTTPCTALAIGDERGRTTRLRVIKVQPHHAAATPITLAESSMADRLQADRPGLQNLSSWPGTVIPR